MQCQVADSILCIADAKSYDADAVLCVADAMSHESDAMPNWKVLVIRCNAQWKVQAYSKIIL